MEYDAFENAANMSTAYRTMTDNDLERNLYSEERKATIGRRRPGNFVPG